MLFDIPFIADWKNIGEHRQLLTDRNTAGENEGRNDYDYQVGQKVKYCDYGCYFSSFGVLNCDFISPDSIKC